MKTITKLMAIAAIVLPMLSSCSGDGATSSKPSLFGQLPEEYVQFKAEKDAFKEKAKEIKTEADKAKLIKQSQEMEEKWTTRIEKSAKALDGKPVAVADGEIKVTEPLSLTFDGFFSKSDITPVFVVSGAAQAAVDITPESEFPRSSYQVYIVGYGPDGAEVFDNRIGTIDSQEIDGKAVISAGTPVKFERLQFSGKDAPDYPMAETLKLVVEE